MGALNVHNNCFRHRIRNKIMQGQIQGLKGGGGGGGGRKGCLQRDRPAECAFKFQKMGLMTHPSQYVGLEPFDYT